MKNIINIILLLVAFEFLIAQDSSQTFLSLKQTGVENFIKNNPKFDGRGTIVFIFDTGVDMGIDGLKETTTGEIKVIDVQDFTEQGDVSYYEAETDSEDGIKYFINEEKNYKVKLDGSLEFKANDDNYFIGLVEENFWRNSNSGIKDINENGKEDDKFYFIVFKTSTNNEEFWVVYFDTNGDGNLGDEKPIRNYKENQDAFFIKSEDNLHKLTFGLNILHEKGIVSFHFDDGSHGTHCAGIAAGYKIDGESFNGVAPGAKVISCKLGNNNYSGGATVTESMKKCYDYADKVSREREEPCIINMSFGIGSEAEGTSDMEKYIEKLVKNNPYLYIFTSNSNEGPGISTTGLPSSCEDIFSTGAVLTKEVGKDLYGATLPHDVVLYFSSRGAEVRKPNIISPGACTSTVPNYEKWDRFWGTSMASPYSTGVASLILSAAKQEFPDVKVPAEMLYRALEAGATKWDEYDFVDQGAGLINVEKSYEILKKWISSGEISKLEKYNTTVSSQITPTGRAKHLYIRNGNYLTDASTFTVMVNRAEYLESSKFYRTFNLKKNADWLNLVQDKTYIRNDQPTMLTIKFDTEKMKKPGLYNDVITAYRNDGSNFPEFKIMTTVVVPHSFCETNNYKFQESNKAAPGMFNRYFLDVPAGASAMKVRISAVEGKHLHSRFMVHNETGREIFATGQIKSEGEEKDYTKYIYNPTSGVYELVVTGFFSAKDTSYYNLEVEFVGIELSDKPEFTTNDKSLFIINNFSEVKDYTIEPDIKGYKKVYYKTIDSTKLFEMPFKMVANEKSKEFNFEFSIDDFNKFTDFSIMIKDMENNTLESDALSYRYGSIKFVNTETEDTKYKLVLVPGFATGLNKVDFKVTEFTDFVQSSPIIVKPSSLTLYPSVSKELNFDFNLSENLQTYDILYGEISLKSRETKETESIFEFIIKK